MKFSDCWIKLIIVITTVLALLQPTTAGFGDFLNSIINTCQYSTCERHPRCAVGYDTLTTTREGCSGFKEKSYCCPSGAGPQCFYTGCGRETSCPGNYRELDRTRNGCSGFSVKAYCCKTTNLPSCFDLSCPAFSESTKSCPSDYNETKRVKGRSGGCDSAFAERLTCCLRGSNSGDNRIQNGNTNNEVVSETKTITLEDGTVQTVTRTQSHSRTGSGLLFSNAESLFTAFLKILLIFPVLAAIL